MAAAAGLAASPCSTRLCRPRSRPSTSACGMAGVSARGRDLAAHASSAPAAAATAALPAAPIDVVSYVAANVVDGERARSWASVQTAAAAAARRSAQVLLPAPSTAPAASSTKHSSRLHLTSHLLLPSAATRNRRRRHTARDAASLPLLFSSLQVAIKQIAAKVCWPPPYTAD